MARRRWLAKLLVYVMLEMGALGGLPVRPDQVEELTQLLQKTRLVQVVRREASGDGDSPADDAARARRPCSTRR